jgi:hypothetical protein
VESWQVFVLTVVIARLVFLEATQARAQRKADSSVYPITASYRLVETGGTILIVWLVTSAIVQGRWFVLLGGLALLVLITKAVPGPITVSSSGVSQSLFLNTFRRTLTWGDIGAVLYNPRTNQTTVVGKDATQIAHTQVHVDTLGFRRELSKRNPRIPVTTEEPNAMSGDLNT